MITECMHALLTIRDNSLHADRYLTSNFTEGESITPA